MRTRARHWAAAQPLVAVAFTAAITISPASAQAADVLAQIDSLGVALQRLTPDATSGRTLRSQGGAERRDGSHCIAHGEVVYIKLSAKDTGAAERARSMVQLLNGHSDVRESVEEVMQIIENDCLLAKDDTWYELARLSAVEP
jgi:hypothetical protein